MVKCAIVFWLPWNRLFTPLVNAATDFQAPPLPHADAILSLHPPLFSPVLMVLPSVTGWDQVGLYSGSERFLLSLG